MDDSYINDKVEVMNKSNSLVIHAKNAVIEEIFHDNRSSLVTISYGVLGDFNMIYMTLVRLVVDRDTIIRNRRGQRISARDLAVENVVDASFSAAMTRSIPPQSGAYMITQVREKVNQNLNPNRPNIVEDRIMEIDANNDFVYTGNSSDMMSQVRFVVNDRTEIFDRRGNRIRFRDLRTGQRIRVEHADFMTMSIPPQTNAIRIWVLY